MALAPYALATLAEYKSKTGAGDGVDLALEEAINRASLDVLGEGLGSRRGVYYGPVEDYDSIVTSTGITNGALTIAAPPNSAGRTIVVRKTDADRSLKAGTLTITQASPALSETFDLSVGNELHGVEFFTSTVTATLTNCVGNVVATDLIEVGTSVGYTELFSPYGGACLIRPLEWPIQNVVAINEDRTRAFADSSLLVETTDYEVLNAGTISRGIVRLSNTYDWSWLCGRRVVRVRYSGGWRGVSRVPENVKAVTLELAAWYFQHDDRKEYGLQTRSDGIGTVTRNGPPMLIQSMLNRLASEYRFEQNPTSERAWSDA